MPVSGGFVSLVELADNNMQKTSLHEVAFVSGMNSPKN